MGIHTGPASAYGAHLLKNLTGSGSDVDFPTWSISDGILFLLILVGWAAALCLFLHKWGDVRIPLPRDLIRRFRPMNVDNVRIVKQENKSIIYKSYGKRMSVTMEERDKRLEELRAQQHDSMDSEDGSRLAGRWKRFRKSLTFGRTPDEGEAERGVSSRSLLGGKKERSSRRLSALEELCVEETEKEVKEEEEKADEEAKKKEDRRTKLRGIPPHNNNYVVSREYPSCQKHTQTDGTGRSHGADQRVRCVTPEIRVDCFEAL